MEANELMIGDWVECAYWTPSKQLKVAEIRRIMDDETKIGVYSDDLILIFRQTEVKPIPLTPEILEKNGFEVQVQGGGRKDVWTGFGIDCEGDIEVEFQYKIPIHLKIDGGFKGEYYTSANIKYIHQFQHALRLCGIEKEIEL